MIRYLYGVSGVYNPVEKNKCVCVCVYVRIRAHVCVCVRKYMCMCVLFQCLRIHCSSADRDPQWFILFPLSQQTFNISPK